MLHKEIVHSFSHFQFHKTESGDRTPMQFKYLASLKIARLELLLNRIDAASVPSSALEHITSALRHLTELCIRHRMVLWFAFRHDAFVQKISRMGLHFADVLSCRQMAVMTWTIGKIGNRAFKSRSEHNFTRRLVTRIVQRLTIEDIHETMTVHEAMLLTNGLANLDCTQLGPLLDACLSIIRHDLDGLSLEVFSLFVWSYGKLNYRSRDSKFQVALIHAARRRFENASVQQLSCIAWGLCRMDIPESRTFLIEVLSVLHTRLSEFVPLGLARLIDACYLMNHHPGEAALLMLSNRFSHFRGYATPALCFQALPAFAYFDGFSELLCAYTHQGIKQKYQNLVEAEQMVRILAAYSMGDTLSPSFLERTVACLVEQDKFRDLPHVILRDFWIGIATHRAHYGDIVDRAVPNALLQLAKDAWIMAEANRQQHPFSDDILGVMKTINVTGSYPYCEPDVEVRSDLVCLWENQRIAVFIFDRSDTFPNEPYRLNGRALWTERIFLKLGYGVGRISAFDWPMMDTLASKQNALIHMLKYHRRTQNSKLSRPQVRRIQPVYLKTL